MRLLSLFNGCAAIVQVNCTSELISSSKNVHVSKFSKQLLSIALKHINDNNTVYLMSITNKYFQDVMLITKR